MKNIELIFKDKTIEFASKGDIMGNDIAFDGVMKNSLVLPYQIEKAFLYTKKMDLNRIVNKIIATVLITFSSFLPFTSSTCIEEGEFP